MKWHFRTKFLENTLSCFSVTPRRRMRRCQVRPKHVIHRVSTLWWRCMKFKDFSRTFKAIFQQIQGPRTGKFFWKWHGFAVNNSLYSIILITITNVKEINFKTLKDFYWFSRTLQSWNFFPIPGLSRVFKVRGHCIIQYYRIWSVVNDNTTPRTFSLPHHPIMFLYRDWIASLKLQ
jgi:hypothetical protein